MLRSFVLAAGLSFAQKPVSTGVVAGAIIAPPQQKISQPVQVILLPPRYVNLWNSDVQKRLDVYWETLKPMFAVKKEAFAQFSKQAHREATTFVLTRMRRDPSTDLSQYLMETSADGTFEFKGVPFGEYKVLAVGKIGDQEIMWQEFVDVRDTVPRFLEVKQRVP